MLEIIGVSIVLVVVVVLLVSEKAPVDLVALGTLAVLMLSGLLEPAEALAGFANPAPITIAALLIVSRALVRTGGLDWLADRMIQWTRGRPRPLLVLSLVLTGLFSAFINNTPVVVLFISMFLAFCSRRGLSPSKYLLPISMMSILAGTTTLIGTSTNIVVSDLGAELGCAPIGLFELGVLGLPLALAGGLYLLLVSRRLLPEHRAPVCSSGGEQARYISELLLPEDSPLAGREARAALAERHAEVELFEVIRGERVLDPHTDRVTLAAGDRLLCKATASDLVDLLDRRWALLPDDADGQAPRPFGEGAAIVELVVPPGSEVVGSTVAAGIQTADSRLQVIGLRRGQHHFSGRALAGRHLTTGDILLVQCPDDCLQRFRGRGELIVLEEVAQHIQLRRRAPVAVITFAAMVGAAAAGAVDIATAAVAAAFVMIATGCVGLRGAYRALDVKVLMLLVGTIALGTALRKTGAADLYAEGFLSLFRGAGAHWVLAGTIVLTSALSHVVSNNATAVLMVPVALSTAAALGVDGRPFLIGICFGASACFASPIGYQTNLLVYAPGGYRFGDFIRLGLPLSLLVCAVASLFVPWIWPL